MRETLPDLREVSYGQLVERGVVARTWYRWVVLAVGTLAQAATTAVILGLPSVTPALRTHFGLDLAGVGVLLTTVIVGTTMTLIPWGGAADRFGERGVMTIGLIAEAGVLTLLVFADTPIPAGILLLAAGAAGGSVNAASGSAVMTWFAAGRRGLAMAIRQSSVPLGAAAGAAVLPRVAEAGGIPAVFGLLAAGCAVAAVAVALGIREAPNAPPRGRRGGTRITEVLRDARLLRVSVAGMLLVVPQFLGSTFLVEVLVGDGGVAATTAGTLLALTQLLAAFGRLGWGVWSDRVGSRLRPLRVAAVAVATGFVATVAAVAGPTPLLAVVLVLTTALAASWNNLVVTAVGELAPPGRAATAIALSNTVVHVGSAVTPAIGGALAQAAGWSATFTVGAVTALAALGVLYGVGETRR